MNCESRCVWLLRASERGHECQKEYQCSYPQSPLQETLLSLVRGPTKSAEPLTGGRRACNYRARHTRGSRTSPTCGSEVCRSCAIFITRSCDIHCSCIYHRRGAHRRLSIVTTTAGYAAIVFASKLACLLASSSRASIERSCGTESSSHAREACPRRGA